MSNKNLNDDAVAKLESQVTGMMMGLSFTVTHEFRPPSLTQRRTATIALSGGRSLRIALSANDEGCAKLGSAMFAVHPTDVDGSMKNDSLGELLNMISGQLQRAMSIDSALGLPALHEEGLEEAMDWRNIKLRSGEVELCVSLSD